MKHILAIASVLLLSGSFQLQAQGRFNFSAGKLSGTTVNGVRYNIFESSPSKRVTITQNSKSGVKTTVYCNRAEENAITKDVTATGRVKIVQGKMNITGDKLNYFQSNGQVIITGKEVVMTQDSMKLTTDKLFYNMNTGLASYFTGGHMRQGNMDLTSRFGYMDKQNNMVSFKFKVVMTDSVKNQTIETDTMAYDTQTQIATFPAPTFIKGNDGYVYASGGGTFHNATSEVFLEGQVTSQNIEYSLDAQSLYLNDSLDYGIAKDKAKLFIKEEKISIFGDEMKYGGEMTDTKAYGHAYMEMPMSLRDTLYLSADTLFSVVDTADNRTMFAYNNVEIYSKQMQGMCDSLVYNVSDSMIYFFKEPVLWSQGSQITGNAISAKLEENDIDKMFIDSESFIISKDSIGNFNQIKGKKMVAHFDMGFIQKVDVEGNGETIYYALEGDTVLLGMNYINCSSMAVHFADSNQISDITFISKPESKFIPPHELKEEDQALGSFNPMFNKTPSNALVYRLKNRLDAVLKEEEAEPANAKETNE